VYAECGKRGSSTGYGFDSHGCTFDLYDPDVADFVLPGICYWSLIRGCRFHHLTDAGRCKTHGDQREYADVCRKSS
jgi:hypothetical protein